MSIESFISDLKLLAYDRSTGFKPSAAGALAPDQGNARRETPLTTRWLNYEKITPRQTEDAERSVHMRSIAYARHLLAESKVSKDEIDNMQDVLTRLCNLVEQRRLLAERQREVQADDGGILAKISDATAVLDDALFKRQKFMIATSDYASLPDKMADEVIHYLARMKPSSK